MPRLGAHMSIAGGVDQALLRGKQVGCDAIQIFTKSPNQWRAKDLADDEVERFHRNQSETGIHPIVGHTAYLINLGTSDEPLWNRSIDAFVVEMERSQRMRLPCLVTHPGAHTGAGEEIGMECIGAALNTILRQTPQVETMILLEITAGQGSVLGHTFEQLARMITMRECPERLGVCYDTAHAFTAGYDVRTRATYEQTFREFDRVIGLERLRAFHLNDTKKAFQSHVDRHDHIGQGQLGLEAFRLLLNDPRFAEHPMCLETPKAADMHDDAMNLATLRGLIK